MKKYFAIYKSNSVKQCDILREGNLSIKIYSLKLMYNLWVIKTNLKAYVETDFPVLYIYYCKDNTVD